MSQQTSVFPGEVWDGLDGTNRASRQEDQVPDSADYDALSTEVISVETYVKTKIGPTGPIGPSLGPTGATGAAGATGVAGATGAVGSSGASGASGPTGLKGTTGATGAVGPSGASGPTGAAGHAGVRGASGVNAWVPAQPTEDGSYELTIENGIPRWFKLLLE